LPLTAREMAQRVQGKRDMMRTIGQAALALLLLLSGRTSVHAQSIRFDTFVTRRGDQLIDGDQSLRFVSFNIPNLLVIEDAFEFLGESPWRWPDEFEINDALESIRQMGGRVARSYVLSVRREGSDMGECVHVRAPGEFNEDAFAALDLVLKVANEKGIRVIIPLVDNWKWMGGAEQYAAFRGKQAAEFWTDRQLIDDFKQTVRFVLTRRNTLTGQLYRDDKAILGWETGNEIDAPPEWTAEIAAYLKELDANHLVIDGRSLHGVPLTSLEDPNVDVVTTHHYPAEGVNVVERINAAAAAARGRRPYFVGEIGFIPVEVTRDALDAVIQSNTAGALYWSLRFHRREGGFYWHSEPAGENLFKAYHWPGFASGDEYRERDILDLIVRKAAEILGGERPELRVPQPVRLLPIEHPGRIAWQGSTGAAGYDIERGTSAEGPWIAIARSVSDAATQYRPLFSDSLAAPGQDYFYRVVAHNGAGAAAPSNVVGPIGVDRAFLVDEMQDVSLMAAAEGPVRRASAGARRVREDAHRMAIGPGGSLTYKLPPGRTEATIWAFASGESGACDILTSRDGARFVPLKTKVISGDRGSGDYGYLLPVLIRAAVDSPGARFLRIAHNATPPDVATFPDGEPSEVEISRVEIGIGLD
jgi:mannan endo-1,4-beta-mannosidase